MRGGRCSGGFCRSAGRSTCQGEFDPPVGLAPGFGCVVGDGNRFTIAFGGQPADQHTAALQTQKHRFGAGLRQGQIAAFAALTIGIAADFHLDVRAAPQLVCQRAHRVAGVRGDLGRSRCEGDLLFRQRRVQRGDAFFGRRQGRLRVKRLIVAHIDLEGLTLAQLARKRLGDRRLRPGRGGDARHLDRVGPHQNAAFGQLRHGLQPRQHADRPAIGQAGIKPRGGVDGICPEMRLGET